MKIIPGSQGLEIVMCLGVIQRFTNLIVNKFKQRSLYYKYLPEPWILARSTPATHVQRMGPNCINQELIKAKLIRLPTSHLSSMRGQHTS